MMGRVRVGLLHPGEMGAAIGAMLVEQGHTVLWLPRGRSEETTRRAAAAGLTAAEDLADAEVILSVCPPHAALEVARSLPGTSALVIDANAVSPTTATRIGELIGERWVDGGIVGPPPRQEGTTRLYLSGTHALEASLLFESTPLEPVVLDGSPGRCVGAEDGLCGMDQGLGGAASRRLGQCRGERRRGGAAG